MSLPARYDLGWLFAMGSTPHTTLKIFPFKLNCHEKNEISQAGAKTSALLQGQMRPIHRLLRETGDLDICQRSAEALMQPDFEMNAAQDVNICRMRLASTVRSSVRCD